MSDHSTARAVLIPEVIRLISNEYKVPLEKAMDDFYMSKTCDALSDEDTDLYSQSALFVFSLYQQENSREPPTAK